MLNLLKRPRPAAPPSDTVIEGLEELRRRLIWTLAALGVCVVVGFVIAVRVDVVGAMSAPIRTLLGGARLLYLSPTEPFFVTLQVALLVGVVLCLPVVLYHLRALLRIWLPAGQQRLAWPMLGAVVGLFAIGALFCFYAVVPITLRFTLGFQTQSLEPHITIGAYISLLTHMLLAFGLAFQLPVVVLICTLIGVLTPGWLAGRRRHVFVGLVVVGALLTPPDMVSQLLLAGPMYALFELGVLVSRLALARGMGRAAPAGSG